MALTSLKNPVDIFSFTSQQFIASRFSPTSLPLGSLLLSSAASTHPSAHQSAGSIFSSPAQPECWCWLIAWQVSVTVLQLIGEGWESSAERKLIFQLESTKICTEDTTADGQENNSCRNSEMPWDLFLFSNSSSIILPVCCKVRIPHLHFVSQLYWWQHKVSVQWLELCELWAEDLFPKS